MAQLAFDTQTGIVIPTTEEIRADIVAKIVAAFKTSDTDNDLNTEPTSPMGQVVDALVAEIEAKNSEVAFVASQLCADTATGVFLDAIGKLYFLERKVSEPTVVTCQVTGLAGTVIPFGAVVQDTSGRQYRQMSTAGITIGSDGTGEGVFDCTTDGAITVLASTVTKIVTVIAGWDTVTNSAAGVIGRDAESDAEFRVRIKQSAAINARGSLSAIKSALMSIDDVLDCEVLENKTNASVTKYGLTLTAHSIGACIVGGADADIAQTIYEKVDAGCDLVGSTHITYTDPDFPTQTYDVYITRPTSVAFKVKITCYTTSLASDVQTKIKEAIIEDFTGQGDNERIGVAETVYANRFWAAVINAVPSAPITTIEIGVGASPTYSTSVAISATQSPAITTDDISFVFAEE